MATAEEETPRLDRDLGLEGTRPPPDDQPLEADLPPPPAQVQPVVVPRWIQLVALPLAVLALWALARAAGTVLLVFVVASVIALILNPLVRALQLRAHFPRGLAVLAVYVGFFIALGGGVTLLVNPVSNQVESFSRDVPNLVDSANASLADVQSWLDDQGINIEVKRQGETALETLQRRVQKRSGDLVSFTRDLLTKLVEAAFALILILVISIYMLLYGDQIGRLVRSAMPPGDGTPEDDYPLRVQKAVSGYVRGQAAFSLIMGLSAGAALWLVGAIGVFPDGRRYALFFGIFYGLMEAVPYVGPILGALPAILVALFDDPLTAVWVVLLFVALQQLEGHVVAPQVFGHSLRINPLLVIFALLVGAELYGIVGALVALPLAAVARETTSYLRRHLVLEPWGTPGSLALAGGGPADTSPPERPCPECGTRAAVTDAYCRSCGAGLRRDADPPG
jgi:predicted PurR-regulated permease PerM